MSKTLLATPEDAEQAFYEAFNRGDLDALMSVWSEDDDPVCIHPGGSRFTGLAAIRESWKQLFETGMKFRVRTSNVVRAQSALLAVHSLLQHVHVEGDDTLAPPLITTNVYVRGASGWQLMMHHTSPSPDASGLLTQESPRVVH
ncbi:MAG: nuclear transport factor 2 family protein [Candidatus Dactylopiibacterium sp.]|nr:nuclear transport factor 2 family protein [Candidatus Dactylopiibacterium sp.]